MLAKVWASTLLEGALWLMPVFLFFYLFFRQDLTVLPRLALNSWAQGIFLPQLP
jgi:hypothetical protein